MDKIHLIRNLALYAALVISGTLLFIGGPALDSSRSSYHIWDLGHIILFAILTYLLVKDVSFLQQKKHLFHQCKFLAHSNFSSHLLRFYIF